MTTAVEPTWDANADGAKKRDYWWTVLAVDPLAIPITRLLVRKRWSNPDEVTSSPGGGAAALCTASRSP